ncbi:hypothetical protein LCGC14_2272180 [marine sediment metagenome]|uniref:Uncharacterized protein n=1 Tax=marine sediment metagenome TaxID=412755 RepID=A0A0F9F980_9ZZZZ
MRRYLDVLLAVFFSVCLLAGAALAAESSPALPGVEISWAKLAVALLGILGLLERVRDWIRRYRQHIDLIYATIEEISASGAPEVAEAGAILKRRLSNELIDAAKPLKDMALLGAVRAEERNGQAPGGATQKWKQEAGRVILRTALRLIPGIGRFF